MVNVCEHKWNRDRIWKRSGRLYEDLSRHGCLIERRHKGKVIALVDAD